MGVESFSGELEVPERVQATETDPVKPHEGVLKQDESENVKGPSHGKKGGAKILKESIAAGRSLSVPPWLPVPLPAKH